MNKWEDVNINLENNQNNLGKTEVKHKVKNKDI